MINDNDLFENSINEDTNKKGGLEEDIDTIIFSNSDAEFYGAVKRLLVRVILFLVIGLCASLYQKIIPL